jgi:hypothetical protein
VRIERRALQRRTFCGLRARSTATEHHHHVYVVLLDPAAGRLRAVRAANPHRKTDQPCVYVGMTGLTPEERFANHKAGLKDAYVVRRYGIRLLPELYAHLNPMPFQAAAEMELDLAEDLRRAGYTVTGGH